MTTIKSNDTTVMINGKSFPLHAHLSTSGLLTEIVSETGYHKFYNKRQYFKWLKENTEEIDKDVIQYNNATYAVYGSNDDYYFGIEAYKLDNLKLNNVDTVRLLLDLSCNEAFFLIDDNGVKWLIVELID